MKRTALVVVLLAACTAPARADTLPLIENVPATYTPGQAFSFDVRVPLLPDLTSYTVQLIFTGEMLAPPLIAFPTVAEPNPTGRYVFSSHANFNYNLTNDPNSHDVNLTFGDFSSPTVARPGINDTLARITVMPGSTLTGDLTISVGPNTNFLYSNEGPFYDQPEPITVLQAAPAGPAVPAPPGAVLLGVGALLLAARARFARRTG